ncbi:MAG TPA: TonB-dependent receptor, partial [Flavobacterium sp.]|nr:TonB-dependent receptor [Flavobacterium sp.]
SGVGFASNALINSLTAATTQTIISDELSEYNYSALFGRVNLNFKERYIVNLTGRRDGSSRFGPGNRFANFGAVGAAWLFSKEAWFNEGQTTLSFGKIRASYGITGNDQIGDYQYLDTYQVTPNIYDGVTGLAPSRLFNPNFGWETNKKFEAAIDLGFINDRITMTAAYFRNESSNQLVGVPLPSITGFTSIQANLDATVQNTGWEFEWRSVNLRNDNFNWTTTANITIPQNKLLEFPDLEGSTYQNLFVIGESLNVQQLYHYTGIDPQTGFYTFQDYNDDGQLNQADRKSIKDTSPQYFGGLTNELRYKNWTFDFLFQFVKQESYNAVSRFPVAGTFNNQPVAVLSHFPQDTTGGAVQQYATGNNPAAAEAQGRYLRSDAAITVASFARLKSLSLSYAIPAKSITAKVYLQGQNLLTFTKYKGADPENQSIYSLPPLRQLTLGIQLSF